MQDAVKVLVDIEKMKRENIGYGDLGLYVYLIKRLEKLPEDITLAEFHTFLMRRADQRLLLMGGIKDEQEKDNPARDSS